MTAGFYRFAGLAAAVAAGGFSGPQCQGQQTGAAGFNDAALRSTVSGVVRDRGGQPQVGALVELLNTRYAVVARTFTDDRGRYSLRRLGAGFYQVKATSELLLPALRPDLRLLADTRAVVNLTLASMYQALDWLPAEPKLPNSPTDEWDWTLRLATNRPLLRVLPPDAARRAGVAGPVLVEGAAGTHTLARSSIGVRSFGEGGFSERLQWRSASEGGQAVVLGAQVGRARLGGTAGYRRELAPDHFLTTVASYTERPGIRASSGTGLETARIRSASTFRVAGSAELNVGTELAGARLGGAAVAAGSHPFVSVRVPSGSAAIEYRAATATTTPGADRLEAEAGQDRPGLSTVDGRLRFEQGLHQELRVSRRVGSWTGEVAAFDDELRHPVVQGSVQGSVQGVGRGDEAAIDSKDVLFDPETGVIAVSGRGYSHGGVLAMLRDQLSPDTWLSLRFAMGEALTAPLPGAGLTAFGARSAPSAAVAGGTRLAATGTAVRGSYRWQPVGTVTSVAPFEAEVPDAYLGFSARQPLHFKKTGAAHVEAVLDVRNLLAQGYRPFLSEDGSTVFFAQAQRTIAGGLSFSF